MNTLLGPPNRAKPLAKEGLPCPLLPASGQKGLDPKAGERGKGGEKERKSVAKGPSPSPPIEASSEA